MLAGACVATAIASQAQTPPVFTGGVDLIKVAVTVTDRGFRFVPGLRQEDFVLYDDLKPQQIATFSSERAPVSLGALFDASRSMTASKMASARAALTTFFNLLGPDDELFVAQFCEAMRLLPGWTTDRALLQQAMLKLRGGAFTALFDSMNEAMRVAASGKHPRKALLLITDGDDTFSISSAREVRSALRGYDVMVYTLRGVQERPKNTPEGQGRHAEGPDRRHGWTHRALMATRTSKRRSNAWPTSSGSGTAACRYPPPAGPAKKWRDIKVRGAEAEAVDRKRGRGTCRSEGRTIVASTDFRSVTELKLGSAKY